MTGEGWGEAVIKARTELNLSEDADTIELATKAKEIYWLTRGKLSDDQRLEKFKEATSNAEVMNSVIAQIGESLHSVVRSVLVQAWTAFEVMAGDLWEGALNEHPHVLAGLHEKSNSNREVPLWVLQKHNFDLSNVMGTILKEKFNFTVLADIRKAYLSAFSKKGLSVKTAIENDALDALSLLRNLLVHKAGMIDETFLRQAEKIPSLKYICSCGEGVLAPLDGVSVAEFMGNAVVCAYDLIQAVDNWISSHPQRNV